MYSRTVLALLSLAAAVLPALAAPATQPAITVSVDPRVELICIIFRLAGNPEYSRGKVDAYTRDVEQHFRPFANHAVVNHVRQLRRTRGVSFDAPMGLAVLLSDPPDLKEAVPLEPRPDELDLRWRPDEVRQFLVHARDFAKQSNFEAFFAARKGLYTESAGRMSETLARHARLDWFDQFFGRRPGVRFHLILGMLNGGSCYGARRGETDLYCILGVWMCDADGLPRFDASVVPTVIHEFCHSYVNPLVYRHADALEPAGMKLFDRQKDAMRRQAYGNWKTMMLESLVRACVVRYCAANDGAVAAWKETQEQHARGFPWMNALAGRLTEYEKDRVKYPTLDDFMPRIKQFFEDHARKLPDAVN